MFQDPPVSVSRLTLLWSRFALPTDCSCFLPLGMESGYLPDSALSASTSYDANHIPQFSRLNKIPAKGKAGAWCAASNNRNQWLQVFFGRETTVTKVAIQGRYSCCSQWVASFKLSYSSDGIHWAWYRLSDGQTKVNVVHSTILLLLRSHLQGRKGKNTVCVTFFILFIFLRCFMWTRSIICWHYQVIKIILIKQ